MSSAGVLAINEIFYSIQGESSFAGKPCIFVRLQGCPLRCRWCDTEYAFYEGQQRSFESILSEIKKHPSKLVQVTGGEPLAQKNCTDFMSFLCDEGYTVMLETSGAFSLEKVPSDVKVIMDIKAPGSGESHRNLWDNLAFLKPGKDELKFVLADHKDFLFAEQVVRERKLTRDFEVLLSPVFGELELADLADWVKGSGIDWRMQLQMHKQIWPDQVKGV